MTGKTHIVGGIAASAVVLQLTPHDPIMLVIGGVFGSLFPDICHSGSKIGRKAPGLSKIISSLFGHRTITHSLLFLILVQFLLNSFVPYPDLNKGIMVGMVSHLVLDAATKNGIKLLYPLSLTIRFPITIRTGSSFEKGILAVLILTIAYFSRGYL
ncbi:metal-dependent hydrolase [Sediminibacillus massiliensis]|uniref:metal-dependent hydrolase n=1 Tax=Sediminibacillus massiliensis TaxID=1926277 RepID=UPI0009886B75|nr:metal-dependent hydrolase [Sediminibacillus massiliensis]